MDLDEMQTSQGATCEIWAQTLELGMISSKTYFDSGKAG